jgi:citrate synthase
MSETAVLHVNGGTFELPVLKGSEDELAVDISKLRQQSGVITMDPGYANTGSCRSAITFIDGERGVLRYRGIPIEQLAAGSHFLECAWLLMYGELPSKQQLDEFTDHITYHTMVHEDVKRFYAGFPKDAHPMAITGAVVGALATFYPDSMQVGNDREMEVATHRLIAKVPAIVAYSFKHSIGQPFMTPLNKLDYASNFLHMMFATPAEEYEVDPLIAQTMDQILLLHADHEQNCSASTVRMVGSSQANLFSAISAGVHALWGPLHGGANQAVIEMLGQINSTGDDGKQFLQKVKDKKTGLRLMGFGHRVYRNFDPRAQILKKATFDLLEKLNLSNPLLDIAIQLEEIALNDDYFIERKLYPNVDFYSGIILQAIGVPVNMFPTLFAIGRLPGWIAQWSEMIHDPDNRIARPRQIYVGPKEHPYVPMSERS